MAKIDTFLDELLKRNGSDLHFIAGDPPRVRQYGVLGPLRIGEATGLYPLEGPIQDQPGNATTFRLLARADNPNLNRLRALCAKGNQP